MPTCVLRNSGARHILHFERRLELISAITVTTTTALRLPEEVEEYSLPSAIRTVSKTPADVVGLTDRGEIAARKCADPIRIHQAGDAAAVRSVCCGGNRLA
jgi:alpha-D-ribose 1-methylphosphonate 5-triphosphate diphosphatase PhnM